MYECVTEREKERSLGVGAFHSVKKKRQVIFLRVGARSKMANVRYMHSGSICSQIICSMNVEGKRDIFPLYSLHIDNFYFVLSWNKGCAHAGCLVSFEY